MEAGQYSDTEDIFGFSSGTKKSKITTLNLGYEFLIPRRSCYSMMFSESSIYEERYPEHIATALARVGGLLALLKFLALIFKEYHRRNFEKEQSMS